MNTRIDASVDAHTAELAAGRAAFANELAAERAAFAAELAAGRAAFANELAAGRAEMNTRIEASVDAHTASLFEQVHAIERQNEALVAIINDMNSILAGFAKEQRSH